MTDSSGNLVYQTDYIAYGQATVSVSAVTPAFGYAGYFVHDRSNLNLTVHRAYSANLARFLNRDPIDESSGINLYGYVGWGPVIDIDPCGLRICPKNPPKLEPPSRLPPNFPDCGSNVCCTNNFVGSIKECDIRFRGLRSVDSDGCCTNRNIICHSHINSGREGDYPGENWSDCF